MLVNNRSIPSVFASGVVVHGNIYVNLNSSAAESTVEISHNENYSVNMQRTEAG